MHRHGAGHGRVLDGRCGSTGFGRLGLLDAHEDGGRFFADKSGALRVGAEIFVGGIDRGLVEDGQSRADVEFVRWLEAEGAAVVARGVVAVEQWHGRQTQPAIGQLACTDHRGEIERFDQLEVQSGLQHALEVLGVFRRGGEDQLEQNRRIFHRLGQRDDALLEKVL